MKWEDHDNHADSHLLCRLLLCQNHPGEKENQTNVYFKKHLRHSPNPMLGNLISGDNDILMGQPHWWPFPKKIDFHGKYDQTLWNFVSFQLYISILYYLSRQELPSINLFFLQRPLWCLKYGSSYPKYYSSSVRSR